MSVKKSQAIVKCFIDVKNSVWFTLRKTKPCFVTHNFFHVDCRSSLPRSRFLDVTQRSRSRFFGGALRDIQKTAARETTAGQAGFSNTK